MTVACPACGTVPEPVSDQPLDRPDVVLSVPTMRCAACISAIEARLVRHPQITQARVNLTLKRVYVHTDLNDGDVIQELARIGYEAYALDQAALGQRSDQAGFDLLLRMGVAGFAMMNVMLLSVAVWSGASSATRDLFHLISAAIAVPSVFYAAQPFFKNAMTALRVGRLNMDVPISLAILLAAGMSLYESLNGGQHAYFDAALSLTFFLLIGRYLEHRTRASAQSAAKELSALEVHKAQRKRGAVVESVAVGDLALGDHILVATGTRVPVDGRLIEGRAVCDRAFLTGESEPVTHGQGALLRAGEINLAAPFVIEATALGEDTSLRQIAQLVETAEAARNSYTSLADRAAALYAPLVHILSAAAFAVWWWVSGDLRHSINIAIAVLIITCPCALGLAVPAVATAAIGRLYKLGFLVKSGTALERLAEVDTVVFDKTGTLTVPGFDFDVAQLTPEAMGVARSLAQASMHPVSQAVLERLGDVDPVDLEAVQEYVGQGITATWQGQEVRLGNGVFVGRAAGGLHLKIGAQIWDLGQGERLRDGAADVIRKLSQTHMALEILTGDTQDHAAKLSSALHVPNVVADVMPEQKYDHIQALQASGAHACMIGDGINDSAALAAAHASIAPSTALDAARNAADVVLIRPSLAPLPELFEVSRKAVALSQQNFAIATAYNVIAIPIALMGYATPLVAALAMSASSITVLLNAMRVRL